MNELKITETHVDDGNGSCADGPQVWTILCGAQCIVFDEDVDGYSIAPQGFDFYGLNAAYKASCKCKSYRRAAGIAVQREAAADIACQVSS